MSIVRKMGCVIKEIPVMCLVQKAFRIYYGSKQWKVWRATITPGICYYCASMNGKILKADDSLIPKIPVHPKCKCAVDVLIAVAAGTATSAGATGVDMYMVLNGVLPDYYITDAEAVARGWKKWLGNLAEVLPGKMIGGKIYNNRNHRLPEADGRIWHEADFDYTSGYRNNCRLLYSNDGLLFVTYNHYLTFYEVGLEYMK